MPQRTHVPEQKSYTIEDLEKKMALQHRVSSLENILKWVLGGTGLSLVVIVGTAFWLGSKLAAVDSSVQVSSEKVNKVHEVVWESENSLAVRTSLLATQIGAMDKKLDTIDTKLSDLVKFREKVSVNLRGTPEPVPEER